MFQHPLVQGLSVFLPKRHFFSIPGVEVKALEDKGRKVPKDRSKLYPRGLFSSLLDLLIPTEVLKEITCSQIPEDIPLVIKCKHLTISCKLEIFSAINANGIALFQVT